MPFAHSKVIRINDPRFTKSIIRQLKSWREFTKNYSPCGMRNLNFLQDDIWLLCVNDKIAGYMELKNETDYVLLRYITVRKSYRRKGYGTKMLRKLEKITRTRHKNIIKLVSYNSRIRFYNKRGFRAPSKKYLAYLTKRIL